MTGRREWIVYADEGLSCTAGETGDAALARVKNGSGKVIINKMHLARCGKLDYNTNIIQGKTAGNRFFSG